MGRLKGRLSAIFKQTTAASQAATGEAMSRVGTTMWWAVTSNTKRFWDKAKSIVIYDGVTNITANVLEWDYAYGAVKLSAVPSGAVTGDFSYFACEQVGGFRAHDIELHMQLEEGTCYGDLGEVWDPTVYGGSGNGEGFWSSVQPFYTMAQGSHKDLTITARPREGLMGTDGELASFEIAVAGNNTPLSVAVTGYDVVVNQSTGAGGSPTGTAKQIRDAINQDAEAKLLVKATLAAGSNGTGIPTAVAHTHLSGGVDPKALEQFGEDLIGLFYEEYSTSKRWIGGVIELEKVSLKGAVKGLIGKDISWKFTGGIYEHTA